MKTYRVELITTIDVEAEDAQEAEVTALTMALDGEGNLFAGCYAAVVEEIAADDEK